VSWGWHIDITQSISTYLLSDNNSDSSETIVAHAAQDWLATVGVGGRAQDADVINISVDAELGIDARQKLMIRLNWPGIALVVRPPITMSQWPDSNVWSRGEDAWVSLIWLRDTEWWKDHVLDIQCPPDPGLVRLFYDLFQHLSFIVSGWSIYKKKMFFFFTNQGPQHWKNAEICISAENSHPWLSVGDKMYWHEDTHKQMSWGQNENVKTIRLPTCPLWPMTAHGNDRSPILTLRPFSWISTEPVPARVGKRLWKALYVEDVGHLTNYTFHNHLPAMQRKY
jgi:hypothetical protein